MQNFLFTLTLFFCVYITHLSAENCSNKCVNVLTTVKCHKICITTNGIINTDNNNGGKNDKTDNGDKNNANKKDKDGDDDDIDIDDNNSKNNTNSNNNNNNLDLSNGTSKNSTVNNNSNNTNNSVSESREILDVAIDGLENVFNWFQISSNSTDGIIARCIGAAKGLKVAMPIILFKLGVIVTIVSFLTIFSLKTLGMLGTLLFFNFGGAFSRILPSTSGQLVESPHPQNIHYHFHNRRLQYLNSRNERYFPEMTENSDVYNNNQMVEQNNNEVFNNEPVNYDETDINHMISWDKWNNLVPVPVPVPEDGYENNYRNINDYYN